MPKRDDEALDFLRQKYPNTFRPPGEVKPLQVGIWRKISEELKDNLPENLSLRALHNALGYYCNSKEYRAAQKILGNPRINLAGEIAGEVTKEHIAMNGMVRRPKATKATKKVINSPAQEKAQEKENNSMTATVPMKSLKVTLPLKPEQIPKDILPKEGAPGAAKARVTWNIELENDPPLVVQVSFPVKNYRKILKTIDETQGEVVILLQGRLLGNGIIDGAGLTVQVRKPKEEW